MFACCGRPAAASLGPPRDGAHESDRLLSQRANRDRTSYWRTCATEIGTEPGVRSRVVECAGTQKSVAKTRWQTIAEIYRRALLGNCIKLTNRINRAHTFQSVPTGSSAHQPLRELGCMGCAPLAARAAVELHPIFELNPRQHLQRQCLA